MGADGSEAVSRWANGVASRILGLVKPFFVAVRTINSDLETARNRKNALYEAFLAFHFDSGDVTRFEQGSRFARHTSLSQSFIRSVFQVEGWRSSHQPLNAGSNPTTTFARRSKPPYGGSASNVLWELAHCASRCSVSRAEHTRGKTSSCPTLSGLENSRRCLHCWLRDCIKSAFNTCKRHLLTGVPVLAVQFIFVCRRLRLTEV